MTSCGAAIPGLLEAYGITHVFGIPGTHSIEMYRGLEASGLRHVLPRHEQGGAFMAQGFADVAGRPAACFFITGPGLTNAATGIAQAYQASVPMLVLTPVNPRNTLGKGLGHLHELTDQSAVAKPFTAFSETAMSAAEVPPLIARAFDVFESQRPRPVHIEVPIDVFIEAANGDWSKTAPPARPVADENDIDKAAELLKGAKAPLFLIGGGARAAAPAVDYLARRLGAAVVSSNAAKEIIPHSSPWYLGATRDRPGTVDMLRAADVVVGIGTELSPTDSYGSELIINGAFIRIDLDPHELTSDYAADVALLGDAKETLDAIGRLLGHGDAPDGRQEAIAAAREKNLGEPDETTWLHMSLLDTLRNTLPADTIWSGDMTQVVYTADWYLKVAEPGRYLQDAGFGSLGCALPVALGAKLARPDQPVVAIAGDSGVLYSMQEMATAREEGIDILLYVWNNQALGQIRDDMIGAQIAPTQVEPIPPDFSKMAEMFDWSYAQADGGDALADATVAGLDRSGPTLIEIRDPRAF
ncbi:MAG: 5-guanidino-2-oxopentanoate decarboxylase [Pseudomonadota bacterium]